MKALQTAWQVLWSLPTAAAWVCLAACLLVGFGPNTLDRFIRNWNKDVAGAD